MNAAEARRNIALYGTPTAPVQPPQRDERSVPVPPGNARWNSVPVARYALFHKREESWHFFEVRRPDHGKWQGWTFIGELIGDTVRKIPQEEADKIFTKIMEDPARRMTNYGKHSEGNRCSKCHTELTDPKSIERGIGLDCKQYYENLGIKF